MQRLVLPQTDLNASVLVLGTALFGSSIDEAGSFRLLDRYYEVHGNFLDTSLNYADWQWPVKGISEKTLGKWLKLRGHRQDIIIGTKGACPRLNNGAFFRLQREDIVSDLHQSLHNLQTDTIDLYYLHRDDPSKPAAEIIETLEDQVKAGNIRYYACSNWSLPRIQEACRYAKESGKRGFVANQMMWSLANVNRHRLSDPTLVSMDAWMTQYHEEGGLSAIPYSSQANGFFSGKYAPGDGQSDSLAGRHYYNEINFARLERVQHMARDLDLSCSVIALAYMLSPAHAFPVYPVIGPKNMEQLDDSLAAVEVQLDLNSIRMLEAH
ncbi:aldo/keto reductase [Paenibacillus nasutitermitis]|uniref:Aldo/keto reductase n=1 Tax=Paenibacillus nasutitermitis TaxID=1652958 RepID=A0A917DYZ1_9BACL|nr:aldo/keto reductase [Paenibacillus nasutitermitis]GGD83450.1 aldo/keto reductase [Paenibacillus nasutitermitis]